MTITPAQLIVRRAYYYLVDALTVKDYEFAKLKLVNLGGYLEVRPEAVEHVAGLLVYATPERRAADTRHWATRTAEELRVGRIHGEALDELRAHGIELDEETENALELILLEAQIHAASASAL